MQESPPSFIYPKKEERVNNDKPLEFSRFGGWLHRGKVLAPKVSQILIGSPFCVHMYLVQNDVTNKQNGAMRKEFINYILCLARSSVLCLRTNIKMRDQNLVVRGKNLKRVGELIGPKALRSFVIKGRKLNLKPQIHHVSIASTCQ